MILILGVNFRIALDTHVLSESTRISHYSTIMRSLVFSAAVDILMCFDKSLAGHVIDLTHSILDTDVGVSFTNQFSLSFDLNISSP